MVIEAIKLLFGAVTIVVFYLYFRPRHGGVDSLYRWGVLVYVPNLWSLVPFFLQLVYGAVCCGSRSVAFHYQRIGGCELWSLILAHISV